MASSTAPVQAAERSVSCRRSRVSMARPPADSPRSEQWQGGRRSLLYGACGGESGYSCLDCRPPPERPVPRPGRAEAHGSGSARRCEGRVPEAVSPGGRGNRPPRARGGRRAPYPAPDPRRRAGWWTPTAWGGGTGRGSGPEALPRQTAWPGSRRPRHPAVHPVWDAVQSREHKHRGGEPRLRRVRTASRPSSSGSIRSIRIRS